MREQTEGAVKTGRKNQQTRLPHSFRFYGSLILICFVAGFLGAAVLLQTRMVGEGANDTIKSPEKVISAEGDVMAKVAKKAAPSIVSVTTKAVTSNGLFSAVSEGAATGIIISRDGYVITNKHVVQDAQNISLVTHEGMVYQDVEYVGGDPLNDLAFLKIKNASRTFTPAPLADSSKVEVGQKAIAIGNALGQFQNSVTSGIISGRGRPVVASSGENDEQLDNLFQTDAAINPGNSGGPLLNLSGEVIAINTAVAAEAQGISFAIPINAAKGLIKGVLASHAIKKTYLGVRYLNLTPQEAEVFKLPVRHGAYVYESGGQAVIAGSPAAKAGLQNEDIITNVNGQKVDENNSLALLLAPFTPGEKANLTILRGGSDVKTIEVTLGEYKAS